jgi:HD-GYP domain-containing protein (c-di-GMP phosphodiesterase class II)
MMTVNLSPVPQNLQRALVELTVAYDATVEAFSRAIELREGEPLGHTRLVTEVTVRLARVLGVSTANQVHIRRGALLHDVGVLGVPESILKKEEKLTKEELATIKLHPQYAYDLLMPIVFLHQAIEIPYYHHERWDGSGYPQGLKGEEIPLSARIFAVVDVWDALISNRPHRKAWPEELAVSLIREQAGLQFDPNVVDAFLKRDIRKKVTKPLV